MKRKKAADNEWRTKGVQNSDRCWWWLASLFLAVMLAMIAIACDRDSLQRQTQTTEEEGSPATLRIDVSTHEPATTQTRAVNTTSIANLHVMVYNSAGELIGKNYAVTSASIVVKTRSASNCTVYAIANTANATLFDGKAMTETALKAMTTPPLTSWDTPAKGTHLLMTGKLTGVNIAAGSPAGNKISGLSVSRVVAQVTLKLTTEAKDNIIIHNYRVYGLPKQTYYIARPTQTEGIIEDTGNTAAGDDAAKTATPAHWISSPPVSVEAANNTSVFYMYENRRGVKINITEQKNKIKTNAPDSAAYVLINGETNGYKYIWRVYLGANETSNFNMKRNCTYTYNIKLKSSGTDTRVSVTDMFENLVGGNANCYMVAPGASVNIPVERANESPLEIEGSVLNPATKTYYQLFYNTEWKAEIVWQRYANSITISNGNDTGAKGKFFTVTAATGIVAANAVVAVKSGGDILWSWHIWVTTYKGATTFKHNFDVTNNPIFMDRALGAEAQANGDPKSCGMYYQFGRKDPFPGIVGSWGDGTPGVAQGVINRIITPTDKKTNLTNSIRNPNTFYHRDNTVTPKIYDWFAPNNMSLGRNLWSGEDRNAASYSPKSVFDPCPKGWRVPPHIKGVSPFQGLGINLTTQIQPATNGVFMKNNAYATYNYWPIPGRLEADYETNAADAIHNLHISHGVYLGASPGTVLGSSCPAFFTPPSGGGEVEASHSSTYGLNLRCVTEVYNVTPSP